MKIKVAQHALTSAGLHKMTKLAKLGTTLLAALCSLVIAVEPACLGAEPPKAKRFRDAIRDGNLDLVRSIIADELLTDAGAEVNARSDRDETPLALCQSREYGPFSSRDSEPVADLLRRHGAVRKLPP